MKIDKSNSWKQMANEMVSDKLQGGNYLIKQHTFRRKEKVKKSKLTLKRTSKLKGKEDIWSTTEDYYVTSPKLRLVLEKIRSLTSINNEDEKFVNMYAVNRIAAIAKAVICCKENHCSFDEFKNTYQNSSEDNIHCRIIDFSTQTEKFEISKAELEYLKGLDPNSIKEEITRLKDIMNNKSNNPVSIPERKEKSSIESILLKIGRRVNAEILSNTGVKINNSKTLINKYEQTLCLTRKKRAKLNTLEKKKEEILESSKNKKTCPSTDFFNSENWQLGSSPMTNQSCEENLNESIGFEHKSHPAVPKYEYHILPNSDNIIRFKCLMNIKPFPRQPSKPNVGGKK
jgi:hypothetical protein